MAKKKWVVPALVLAAALLVLLTLRLAGGKKETPGADATAKPEESAVADAGHFVVKRTAGEAYYPDEKNWVYHFTYAYPQVEGGDYTAALVNDTYKMALGEVKDIVMPMFANSPDMRYDGHNEVNHDFSVTCNTDRLLSILMRQSQTRGKEGTALSLEAQTFNVWGDSAGDTMTLRGTVLLLAGADPDGLEEITAADLPDYPKILAGSSDRMEERLLPLLYEEFRALQSAGTARQDVEYSRYEAEFSPARDFYALPDGRIAFFFPPSLLTEPSFDVPVFTYTAAEIEALL